ncbi:MAG: hypothetical protein J1E29_01235 [Duncaniella sp.]|nr:hypothetical protein [Duncaniella sp.]
MTNHNSHSFFNTIKKSLLEQQHPLAMFKDWEGSYALFTIRRGVLPNGRTLQRIFISHEGDWTGSDAMLCHKDFLNYEDVQSALGNNLSFKSKEYSPALHRTLIQYSLNSDSGATLAVPATGEEIAFEIYGAGSSGGLYLLIEREL